jgi:hypothetical protein
MSKTSHGWYGPSMEARMAAHVHAWEQSLHAPKPRHPVTNPFVTISREFGCEAVPVAHRVAQLLNEKCDQVFPWVSYDRELIDEVAKQLHLNRRVLDALDGQRRSEMTEFINSIVNLHVDDSLVFRKLAEVIRALAIHGHAILVGRGSYWLTQDLHTGLHVRIVAPREWRIKKVARVRALSLAEAEAIVNAGEQLRNHFLNTFFAQDPEHRFRFDITLDNGRLGVEQMSDIIATTIHCKFPLGA